MVADWPRDLNFSDWAVPASFLIGALLVLAILVWGRARFGKRPPPPATPTADPYQADPFTHGSASDKRRALRRRGSSVTVMISDAAGTAPPWQGIVANRSVGGLQLEIDRSVPVGAVLSVRPAQAPSIVPWIQVEIRHCQKTGTTWQVGCQFLRTPPANILWLFG
jgi:hypothetical protein